MGQSSGKSRQVSGIEATDVGQRIAAFLRRRHPSKTAEEVAAETKIGAGTIAKQLERLSSPSCANFLRLACVYGPEFLAEVMPEQLGWLDEAARRERQRQLEERIAALNAELRNARS